jgi:hypothetical protein
MKKGRKIVLYCAMGGAACLVALLILVELFCEEEAPVKFAEQVVALSSSFALMRPGNRGPRATG